MKSQPKTKIFIFFLEGTTYDSMKQDSQEKALIPCQFFAECRSK